MSRSLRHIIILCTLSFVTLYLSSCRPHGILHSWEMRAVMVDLHKTDAAMQYAGIAVNNQEARSIYYAQVLERHGVTQAEFDSSLVWYTAHPQIFDKIYPRVLRELKEEEEAFLALHEEELNLKPETEADGSETSEREFTHAQLDSVLWITQHGYPHFWNEMPLVQNLENQLFPQIGVLSGGVVDTLETSISIPEIPDDKESLPRRKTLRR